MEKPIAQIYAEALDIFKDKERFAQGDYSFNKEGEACPFREGYSFCALGSLLHVADGASHKAQCCLQRVSEFLFDGKHIQIVNDGDYGYEKVLAALSFAKLLWEGYEPTAEELSMPVPALLAKRKFAR